MRQNLWKLTLTGLALAAIMLLGLAMAKKAPAQSADNADAARVTTEAMPNQVATNVTNSVPVTVATYAATNVIESTPSAGQAATSLATASTEIENSNQGTFNKEQTDRDRTTFGTAKQNMLAGSTNETLTTGTVMAIFDLKEIDSGHTVPAVLTKVYAIPRPTVFRI